MTCWIVLGSLSCVVRSGCSRPYKMLSTMLCWGLNWYGEMLGILSLACLCVWNQRPGDKEESLHKETTMDDNSEENETAQGNQKENSNSDQSDDDQAEKVCPLVSVVICNPIHLVCAFLAKAFCGWSEQSKRKQSISSSVSQIF